MGRWGRRPAWGALVALVLVVPALAAGCSIRARPEPPSTTAASAAAPTTTVGTVRGTTAARRAFLLDWDVPGARSGRPGRPLPVAFRPRTEELGDDRLVNLVLVFPLLRCVRQAELWLRVLRFDHRQAVLAAHPSLLVSLASDRPTTRVAGETLIDNRPRDTGTLTADGPGCTSTSPACTGPGPAAARSRGRDRASSRARRWWRTSRRRVGPSPTSRPASPGSTRAGTARPTCPGG